MGILAHVDAGKTTLSEALLYTTGEIRKPGRVDHGDSFLDDDSIERNRGITIFSRQARFRAGDTEVTLIDTPGHVDFAAEMERSLSVLDYALLVVSGSEGVQAHTKTLFRLLKERGIPVFVFVNKMDIAVRPKEDILADMASEFVFDKYEYAPFLFISMPLAAAAFAVLMLVRKKKQGILPAALVCAATIALLIGYAAKDWNNIEITPELDMIRFAILYATMAVDMLCIGLTIRLHLKEAE